MVGGSIVGGLFVAIGAVVVVGAGVVTIMVGNGVGVAGWVAVGWGVVRVTGMGLLSGWQLISNNKADMVAIKAIIVRCFVF
jgi:hypothetical protein